MPYRRWPFQLKQLVMPIDGSIEGILQEFREFAMVARLRSQSGIKEQNANQLKTIRERGEPFCALTCRNACPAQAPIALGHNGQPRSVGGAEQLCGADALLHPQLFALVDGESRRLKAAGWPPNPDFLRASACPGPQPCTAYLPLLPAAIGTRTSLLTSWYSSKHHLVPRDPHRTGPLHVS